MNPSQIRSATESDPNPNDKRIRSAAKYRAVIPIDPHRFDPAQSYRESRAEAVADFEFEYVSWLLDRHQNNLAAAAREVRMDRKHLNNLAKKLDLRRPYRPW